jgi:hypothetical protein
MIYIVDNFLDKKLFKVIKDGANDFKEVKTPGKSFWTIKPSEELVAHFEDKLSAIENKDVINVLAFFRQAKENQDNDWRIHNDTIINGQQPDRAIVFYVDSKDDSSLNGTAFWKHVDHGDTYNTENLDTEEFDRLLLEDANNKDKWELKSVVGYKPNRLLSYPCNYFHSKYPNEFKKSRVVFVMFYKVYDK